MDKLLGAGNTLFDYLLVLLVYGAMYLLIRNANRRVELNFRKTFWILYVGWGFGVLVGNYLFYLIGIMSFLPWLNNAFHTLIWIGLCLSFLYAGCYRKPVIEQVALFVIFSFIVKVAERMILGTWELDNFFGIDGNWAYIIGWSCMDGLYPFISIVGLRLVSRVSIGVVVPKM
ncbi:MAG: hypothetical protein AB7H80_12435 [Candidatus Kapaibacterium sp.]